MSLVTASALRLARWTKRIDDEGCRTRVCHERSDVQALQVPAVVTAGPDTGRRITCNKKHGTWYYRHDLQPGPDGRRQVKQGGFATEREARRGLTDALARIDRGTYVDRANLNVGAYLDQWLLGRVFASGGVQRCSPVWT